MSTPRPSLTGLRTRWSAIGAAVAVSLGAGGIGLANASIDSGDKPVTITIEPKRILDTRTDLGLSGQFADATPRDVQVTGEVPVAPSGTETVVPADAAGVLVNVTVVRPSDPGFLALRPGDATGEPSTSSVNFFPDTFEPNAATVELSPTGTIEIWLETSSDTGRAHVLLDVVGYTIDHTHDDRYYTKTEADAVHATKADAANVYTKTEADAVHATKADAANVYTKTEVDELVESTLTVALSGSAFVANGTDNVTRAVGASGTSGCALNASDTSALSASIQVPIGYKITALQAAFIDSDAVGDSTVNIWHGSAADTKVATVSSSGNPGLQQGVAGTVLVQQTVNPGEWLWVEYLQTASDTTQAICAVEVTFGRD